MPCSIVTSAFAQGVGTALGNYTKLFRVIIGRERGGKSVTLPSVLNQQPAIYITDTVRDILLCRKLRLPAIAVTWGYDVEADLARNQPEYLVHSPEELAILFHQFGLIL